MFKLVFTDKARALETVEALAEAAKNTKWENAAAKAAKKIEEAIPAFLTDDNEFVVIGTSGNYSVTNQEQNCTCTAARHGRCCWHRAAARMVRRLYQQHLVEVAEEVIEEELFAD